MKSWAAWILVLARKIVSPFVSSFKVHVEISSNFSFLNSHKVFVLIWNYMGRSSKLVTRNSPEIGIGLVVLNTRFSV